MNHKEWCERHNGEYKTGGHQVGPDSWISLSTCEIGRAKVTKDEGNFYANTSDGEFVLEGVEFVDGGIKTDYLIHTRSESERIDADLELDLSVSQ